MKVLYFRAESRHRPRALDLPEGVDDLGRLCALLGVTSETGIDVCRFPPPYDEYVLIRPGDHWRRPRNRPLAVMRWDLCFTGDAVVARTDGGDVPDDFDPFGPVVHPFSIYERMDPLNRPAFVPQGFYAWPVKRTIIDELREKEEGERRWWGADRRRTNRRRWPDGRGPRAPPPTRADDQRGDCGGGGPGDHSGDDGVG